VAKTFLRSGNLDAVLALGENGQPVYASALQIRETLRLRRQTVLANCLAIPQPNERGDRLDWYAPFSGKVKSWLGASDHERRQALDQLTATQQEMQDLSARAREADNPAMRLFGALLAKALQFPDQQYVFLVDGKPVITFWGFVDAQARTRDDALACLRDTLDESLPSLLPEPVVVEPQPEMPLIIAEPETQPEPEPAAEAPPVVAPPAPRRAFRIGYLAPVALAVAAAAAFWLHQPQPTPVAAPQPAAPVAATIAPPAALIAAQKLASTLPQTPASVARPADPSAPSATLASVVTPAVPVAADAALKMSVEDVRNGAINVVDGRWRVVMQNSLPGGASPVLHYELSAGKGSATVTQGNNLRCTADEVTAAMLGSGQLSVRSRYTAKCSDGSRYRMPQLMCKPGDGAAVCEALFSDNKSFPMTIKRESK